MFKKNPPPDPDDKVDQILWGMGTGNWITPVADELADHGVGSPGINTGCIVVFGVLVMVLIVGLAS